ncbi:MAG: metallophosphoesterase family protein [Thermoleophilia bacterium]
MKLRLFFATDVHGSEVCWRKFINSAKHYEVDVLILGGDMTGKAIVPIVDAGADRWQYTMQDVVHNLQGEAELVANERLIADHGYYPIRMTHDQVQDLTAHPEKLDDLFKQQMRDTIERWVQFADERLAGTGIQCIVCPGNDDTDDIDEILATSQTITVGEGNVIDMAEGYQLVSSGWTNLTPWDTPREEDEPALKARIESVIAQATAAPERLVLGLHAPPYDTQLDVAPKIDWETLTVQGQDTAHVGSSAVKEIILKLQPLLSLHGHIHESRAAERIGRTLAINPGSSYVEGTLSGVVVELDGKSKVKRYRLTMG